MTDDDEPIAIVMVFALVANLAAELEVSGISKLDGAWVCEVDKQWTVALNATEKPVNVDIENSMGIDALDPYHMAVWFNGWLAGILTARGGIICAGEAGNEDALIKAIEDRISVEQLAKEMRL